MPKAVPQLTLVAIAGGPANGTHACDRSPSTAPWPDVHKGAKARSTLLAALIICYFFLLITMYVYYCVWGVFLCIKVKQHMIYFFLFNISYILGGFVVGMPWLGNTDNILYYYTQYFYKKL